ncbi:MAG TPA: glycosyltransferase family 1 protein [Ktedonobacterales bacterium]|jgi:glycosyltransferase involved in cell wall biosynthesis|nr:glycosyltransferase family 1 protein [Ktedonobacterales bacterium]
MRIAINALFLQEPRTGTGRYLYNLLNALGRVDGVNEYLLLSPREPTHLPETPSTFEWQTVPVGRVQYAGENITKVVWEQHTFPLAAKQAKARLMHVPHFAPPLRTHSIATVVTVHDVIAMRLPGYRATPAAQGYSRLVARAAKHATAILTVSDYSKQDIIELLDVPAERVRVIREAPAPQYRRVTDPERLRAMREKYGLGPRYVLNVGGLDVRKNVRGLIAAFAAVYHSLRERDLQLVIAGNPDRLGTSALFPDWRALAATFSIPQQIVCTPIDEEDLPSLYAGASCFAFTSLYEGFGLPPLEAMACGAPVVCSDRTSLPEVVGSAGVLVDPEDADQLGAALLRVLSDQVYADDLRARGLARARQFTWEQVAAQTSALYAEATGTMRN